MLLINYTHDSFHFPKLFNECLTFMLLINYSFEYKKKPPTLMQLFLHI